MEVEKKQIQDIFTCLLSFLSYLNGNDKYSNIISNIENNSTITQPLRHFYNDKIKKNLCLIFTDYCAMTKIFILYDYEGMNTDKEAFNTELRELKCMADMYLISGIYQKFIQAFNKCIKGFNDLRKGKEKRIYEKAFEYSSNNYNENYIDFVINYVAQFNISITDFFHLFLNGLIRGKFKKKLFQILN